MTDISRCSRCKARSLDEASSLCRATQDETGEYSCPGTEWPLEALWNGDLTEEQAKALLDAEEAQWANRLKPGDTFPGDSGGPK